MRESGSDWTPWSALHCACKDKEQFLEWFPLELVTTLCNLYNGELTDEELAETNPRYIEYNQKRAKERKLYVRKYTVPSDCVVVGVRQVLFHKKSAIKVEDVSLEELAA